VHVTEITPVFRMTAAAKQAQKAGGEAWVIDGMGDPGLGALRETVDIPLLELHERMRQVQDEWAQLALHGVREGEACSILGRRSFLPWHETAATRQP
jgi:hypothetical protein